MNRFFQFIIALASISLISCSPSYKPFTVDLQESYDWTEDELKKIQFYLSQDIVLQRNLSRGESVIEGGKIQVKEGRRIEEVKIPSGTPGVLMFMPKPNRLAISFERGKDKFLMFGPHPKWDGKYVLLGSDWDKRSGEVTYQGKKYHTSSRSAYASLMVDLERVSKVSLARHTAKGRTVRK